MKSDHLEISRDSCGCLQISQIFVVRTFSPRHFCTRHQSIVLDIRRYLGHFCLDVSTFYALIPFFPYSSLVYQIFLYFLLISLIFPSFSYFLYFTCFPLFSPILPYFPLNSFIFPCFSLFARVSSYFLWFSTVSLHFSLFSRLFPYLLQFLPTYPFILYIISHFPPTIRIFCNVNRRLYKSMLRVKLWRWQRC